ncbi:hypothetical protein K438DRAFT_1962334 [Mycena galopus ATCC 62051]|nr:hypothetical protein K438DRAFT_1962334 [Mycena galopus ATCC 62051]
MHVYALLEAAKEQGVPETYAHFLGDGRNTAPTSATGYASDVLSFMEKLEYGQLAIVMGRYYVMDRDKRWYCCGWAGSDTLFLFNYRSDRMRELVRVLGLPDRPMEVTVPKDLSPQCHGTTPNSHSTPQPMTNVLAEWLSKKDVKQARVADGFLFLLSPGALRIRGGLSPTISSITSTPCLSPPYLASIPLPLLRIPRILSGPPPSSYPGPHLHMSCVSAYYSPPQSLPFYATFSFSPTFSMVLPPSFPANSTAHNALSFPLSTTIFHLPSAQTEKYAHVTFFFNSGVEKQFAGEEHFMIPSPKVATCDLYPEMAVQSVADKVAKIVESKKYDFVMFVGAAARGGGGDSHFVHVHLRAEHVLEEWLADFEAQAQKRTRFHSCPVSVVAYCSHSSTFSPFLPPSTTLNSQRPPQVGHTGNFDPAVSDITHTNAAVGTITVRPSLLVAYVDPRRVTAALEFPYFGFPDDRAKNASEWRCSVSSTHSREGYSHLFWLEQPPCPTLPVFILQKEKSFGIHSPAMAMAMARWNARNSSEDEYKLVTRSTVNDVEADQARRTPKRAASLPLVHEGSGLHRSSVPHHPCAYMHSLVLVASTVNSKSLQARLWRAFNPQPWDPEVSHTISASLLSPLCHPPLKQLLTSTLRLRLCRARLRLIPRDVKRQQQRSLSRPISVCLETILYGFYLSVFMESCVILARNAKKMYILGTASTLFIFITIHCILDIARYVISIQDTGVVLEPPNGTIVITAHICWCVVTLIADLFLIFRTFIVWEKNYWVITLPSLVFLANFGVSVWSLYSVVAFNPNTMFSEIAYAVDVIICLTLFTNVLCTGLISYRIFSIWRNVAGNFSGIITMIVESAAVYTLLLIAQLIANALGSFISVLLMALVPSTVGLVFSYIIIRVSRGSSYGDGPSGAQSTAQCVSLDTVMV